MKQVALTREIAKHAKNTIPILRLGMLLLVEVQLCQRNSHIDFSFQTVRTVQKTVF